MTPTRNGGAHIHFVMYQRLFKNITHGYLSFIKSSEKVSSLPSSFQTITYGIFNLIGGSLVKHITKVKELGMICHMRQNKKESNERGEKRRIQ